MMRRVQATWQDEFIRSHPCRLDGFSQQEGRSGKALRDAAPGPCPRCQNGARPAPDRSPTGLFMEAGERPPLTRAGAPAAKAGETGPCPGRGRAGSERRNGAPDRELARQAGLADANQAISAFFRHLPSRVSSQGQGVQASPRLLLHGAVRCEESIFLRNTIIYLKRSKYCVLKDCDEF